MIKTDYLVIGSGIAGLSFALKACKANDVALVTKKKLFDSSTGKAQGGVACVTDKDDTFESHIQDTLVAGDGLCNKEIVEMLNSYFTKSENMEVVQIAYDGNEAIKLLEERFY